MLKNLFSTVVFSFAVTFSSAQGGFANSYFLQGSSNKKFCVSRNAIEAPNGNFIVTGFTHDSVRGYMNSIDISTYRQLTVMATNTVGTMLWTKNYSTNKYVYMDLYRLPGAVVRDQSAFYHAVPVKDSLNKVHSLLIKFDYNGDTLWQKHFYSSQSSGYWAFTSMIKTRDGGLLISGASESGITSLKTNINGNEIWRSVLLAANSTLASSKLVIKMVEDSLTKKIIHLTGYNPNIITADSLGSFLTQTTFTTSSGGAFMFKDMIQTRDQNFILAGADQSGYSASSMPSVPYYTPMALKCDIAGNVTWLKYFYHGCHGINKNFIKALRETPGGAIIAATDLDCTPSDPSDDNNRIIKLTANGNITWLRDISAPHPYNNRYGGHVMNMYPLADGGFIIAKHGAIVGRSIDALATPFDPYILVKIDSAGCNNTTAYCSIVSGIDNLSQLSGKVFSIFPNPAGNAVSVKIDSPFDAAYKIKISDINGRELEVLPLSEDMQLQLNTENYKNGIYFVSVLYNQKSIDTRKLVIIK